MSYSTKKKIRKKKGENGQAIIEFILVIIMILSLVFVFVQLAWGIAMGHYVQYATYMSARAYYAGAETKQTQLENAAQTLSKFLKKKDTGGDILPFVAKALKADQRDTNQCQEPVDGACIGSHPQFTEGDNAHTRRFSWMEGVQYNYAVPLYLLPAGPVGGKQVGKSIGIKVDGSTKNFTWTGAIPLTSDAWLGREQSTQECWDHFKSMSASPVIGSRFDNKEFIEDNGC